MEGDKVIDQIDVTPEKDGGVLKQILREGDSDESPMKGDKVFVHYVGTLEDGTQFDSSRDRGEKFTFTLGKGEVIKAWDMGIASMKRNELCRLTCKSQYAYGASGQPPKIPPEATLIFEVELYDWQGEDLSPEKDGGIIRRTKTKGEGYLSPKDDGLVTVFLVGRHEGNVFDERELSFTLGEGDDHNIPVGLEHALLSFMKSEVSVLTLSPKHGFGSTGNAALRVPADATLIYEVTLKDFEVVKNSWNMEPTEKLERAKLKKDKGTNYFKREKYTVALKQYSKVVEYLQHERSYEGELKKERESLLIAGHLNMAMCYIKSKEFYNAIAQCDQVLTLDSNNVKAHFRKGLGLLSLGHPDEAQKCFESCLEVEKDNKAAAQKFQICAKQIKAQRDREKKMYAGMFDKMAKQKI